MNNSVKETVCSFENLYKAMCVCKRNVCWKGSVAGYVKNSLSNITKLADEHNNGTYEISKYSFFKVYEPKERDIVSTQFKDRVFQRSLCDNYLTEAVSKSFIYDNCACQTNKGTDTQQRKDADISDNSTYLILRVFLSIDGVRESCYENTAKQDCSRTAKIETSCRQGKVRFYVAGGCR